MCNKDVPIHIWYAFAIPKFSEHKVNIPCNPHCSCYNFQHVTEYGESQIKYHQYSKDHSSIGWPCRRKICDLVYPVPACYKLIHIQLVWYLKPHVPLVIIPNFALLAMDAMVGWHFWMSNPHFPLERDEILWTCLAVFVCQEIFHWDNSRSHKIVEGRGVSAIPRSMSPEWLVGWSIVGSQQIQPSHSYSSWKFTKPLPTSYAIGTTMWCPPIMFVYVRQ